MNCCTKIMRMNRRNHSLTNNHNNNDNGQRSQSSSSILEDKVTTTQKKSRSTTNNIHDKSKAHSDRDTTSSLSSSSEIDHRRNKNQNQKLKNGNVSSNEQRQDVNATTQSKATQVQQQQQQQKQQQDEEQPSLSLLQSVINLSRSRISSFRDSSNYNDIHESVRTSVIVSKTVTTTANKKTNNSNTTTRNSRNTMVSNMYDKRDEFEDDEYHQQQQHYNFNHNNHQNYKSSITNQQQQKSNNHHHHHYNQSNSYTQGVIGLTNLGNTCFMNSSLQCLSHTIPLTDYFLGYQFRKEINKTNVLGTKGVLAEGYASLLKEIWVDCNNRRIESGYGGSNGNGSNGYGGFGRGGRGRGGDLVVKPIQLKKHLESFAPQFVGTRQQDAQEVLAYLLDGIHEDLNRVPKKPYVEDVEGNGTNDEADSIQAWHNYLLRDKSVIVDIFQGQLRNTLTCTKCNHRSVKFDPFMYLSIPIHEDEEDDQNIPQRRRKKKKNPSLDECLELFCKEELLTGENQWYCSKCKEHVDAIKKFDLWTLPPILIVHLKRFKHHAPKTTTHHHQSSSSSSTNNASSISWMSRGNTYSYHPRSHVTKLNQKVDFPLHDWKPSIALARTVHEPSYDLYAVSNHFGGFGSGHYTAYAMNRIDDEWYEFNDSNTRRIDEKEVERNSNAAYLLFYNQTERSNKKTNMKSSKSTSTTSPSASSFGSRRDSNASSADSESRISRVPIIYQQSISRPEHWPHHKTCDDDESLRLYKRPATGQSKINVSRTGSSDGVYIKDHSQIFHFGEDDL